MANLSPFIVPNAPLLMPFGVRLDFELPQAPTPSNLAKHMMSK